ncbi:UNKNOWN [Stylonychia lemnae]|uniref:Uncharacterized protein n=1 Tax=Stylonychia lemnae TaxID=5949 RepID=A0A078A261_STYLE|nr:UNKNOWN [Stylonychia lemnae]|eukprot:CDW75588.1 UNKNOWN [Stylonychia lemnae]
MHSMQQFFFIFLTLEQTILKVADLIQLIHLIVGSVVITIFNIEYQTKVHILAEEVNQIELSSMIFYYLVNIGNANCLQPTNEKKCQMCTQGFGSTLYPGTDWEYCIHPIFGKYTFDVSQCAIDSAGIVKSISGCNDGYIHSSNLKTCTYSCGIGNAPNLVYSARGTAVKSECQQCDITCFECSNKGSNNCTSCQKGKYLNLTDSKQQVGQCISKNSDSLTAEIFVGSPGIQNNRPSDEIDGTINNYFNSIQDAIKKAYELGAPYSSAEITISLLFGVHAMVRYNPEDLYMPKMLDQYSRTTKIILQPADDDLQLTIYYKLRDSFHFLVGAGLTIRNLIFEAIDSILDLELDYSSNSKCAQNQFINCCFFDDNGNLAGQPACRNFLYEFNSFIQINKYQGGYIVIKNVVFDNFNTCGAIIRNKLIYRETTGINYANYLTFYQSFLNDQHSAKMKEKIDLSNYNPYNCSNSQTQSNNPCFSLLVANSTFKNFGSMKDKMSYGNQVDPDYLLQYQGLIFDLEEYNGHIQIINNTFENNVIKYESCLVGQYIKNKKGIYDYEDDIFPSYGIKTALQIKSWISIVKHGDWNIDIVDNEFLRNTAVMGIIVLQLNQKAISRVFLLKNNFTQNGGYYDTSVIRVTFIANSYTNVLRTIQSPNIYFCSGLHFEQNFFGKNYGCSQTCGGIIRIYCANQNSSISQVNLDLPYEDLPADVALKYHSTNIVGKSTLSQIDTYNQSSSLIEVTRHYEINMQLCYFDSNWQYESIASGTKGQLLTLSFFSGIATIDQITVKNHIGLKDIPYGPEALGFNITQNRSRKGAISPFIKLQWHTRILLRYQYAFIYYIKLENIKWEQHLDLSDHQMLLNMRDPNLNLDYDEYSAFYQQAHNFVDSYMGGTNNPLIEVQRYHQQDGSSNGFFTITNAKSVLLFRMNANGIYNPVNSMTDEGCGRFLCLKNSNSKSIVYVNESTFIGNNSNLYLSSQNYYKDQIQQNRYDQTSLIAISADSFDIDLIVYKSSFQKFGISNQGSIFKLQSTGKKTQVFLQNTFKYNYALKGGSIYCLECYLTIFNNTFYANMAQEGGDIYIKNSPNPNITFDSFSSNYSQAIQRGGSIMLIDEDPEKQNYVMFNESKNMYSQFLNIQSDNGIDASFVFYPRKLQIFKFQTVLMKQIKQIKQMEQNFSGALVNYQSQLKLQISLEDIKVINYNTSTKGIIYSKGNQTNIEIRNSIFDNITAQNNGGFIYMNEDTSQNNITISNSKFQNVYTSGIGGLIFNKGLSLQLALINKTIIQNLSSQEGGLLYSEGATTDILISQSYINQTTSASGGLFKIVDSLNQTLNILSQVQIDNIFSSTQGGLYHASSKQVNILISDSNFNNITSQLDGGFIYATDTEIFNLDINNSSFNVINSQDEGSFLYIDDQLTTKINLDIQFQDDSSIYTQNGGETGPISINGGGLPYNLANLTFKDQISKIGSIIYLNNSATINIYQSSIFNSKSLNDGGIFYVEGNGQAILNLIDCKDSIQYVESLIDGGIIWTSNPSLRLSIQNCNFRDIYSQGNGGFYFKQKADKILLQNITFNNLTAAQQGSLIYSLEY